MLRPTQIIAIFGVFCSMFYIFKYAGANPQYAGTLCQELIDLQMDVAADVTPLIRADESDSGFDDKMQKAIKTLEVNSSFAKKQNRLLKVQRQLEGKACPAPNLVQITKLAVGTL